MSAGVVRGPRRARCWPCCATTRCARACAGGAALIVLCCNKHSRSTFVDKQVSRKGGDKGAPLAKGDPRILWGVPFPTRRPTVKEVERCHRVLSSAHVELAREEEVATLTAELASLLESLKERKQEFDAKVQRQRAVLGRYDPAQVGRSGSITALQA